MKPAFYVFLLTSPFLCILTRNEVIPPSLLPVIQIIILGRIFTANQTIISLYSYRQCTYTSFHMYIFFLLIRPTIRGILTHSEAIHHTYFYRRSGHQFTIFIRHENIFFFLYIYFFFMYMEHLRGQHTVLCHPRWLPISGLTEFAVCWGGAGFEPRTTDLQTGALPLSHLSSYEPPLLLCATSPPWEHHSSVFLLAMKASFSWILNYVHSGHRSTVLLLTVHPLCPSFMLTVKTFLPRVLTDDQSTSPLCSYCAGAEEKPLVQALNGKHLRKRRGENLLGSEEKTFEHAPRRKLLC